MTEFRGSFFENGLHVVLRAIQSRWVGGTWHMTVAYEGGVSVRRLWCYGETVAASHSGRNVRLACFCELKVYLTCSGHPVSAAAMTYPAHAS
jgi:hypothetical protein